MNTNKKNKHYTLLAAASLAAVIPATAAVTWADFSALGAGTTGGPAVEISGFGGATFDFASTSTVNDAGSRTVGNLGTHGEAELGLDPYTNDLGIVTHFGGTTDSSSARTYTMTFSNFSGFTDETGILYIEGLAQQTPATPSNEMIFSVSGGSPTVATWTQEGTFAPRGNNDVDPTFNPALTPLTGSLQSLDNGRTGDGDSSGIFINIGALASQDTITLTFATQKGDGFIVGMGAYAVPEPSSALLLGLGSLGFFLRRRRG